MDEFVEFGLDRRPIAVLAISNQDGEKCKNVVPVFTISCQVSE
jgi:hypothetical protein